MKKKILLLNPNKWGRGITAIWVASHSSILKRSGFDVQLFDATFYENWSDFEIKINTENKQFKKTDYLKKIRFNKSDIHEDFKKTVAKFKPDIIFWSALSSHIHGEGEYINIEYGHDLVSGIENYRGLRICGGIQATANPETTQNKFKNIDFLISGESELVLNNIVKCYPNLNEIKKLNGINYYDKTQKKYTKNPRQDIIKDLDLISPYDYSLFDKQVFLRPYNGKVLKAIDYEISRGCIYTCSYCVETIIQKYYGFEENNKNGTLFNFKNYLRNKSAKIIFNEIVKLNNNLGIELFRCQDTNFLTINKGTLIELADLIYNSNLNIKLYIETRAEGINIKTVELLKKLKVDGVGMGVELSDQNFRETSLNRFVNQEKIENAFRILRSANINSTAYNIIGLPNQTEESIIETIKFNKKINPNVCSVAFYSKYDGTDLTTKAISNFDKSPKGMDAQIRSKIINHNISSKLLNFYKDNFNYLVKTDLKDIDILKKSYNH
jgi:radical SAM superfamily enzyme YgiQ (UPF0313 family)